MLSEMLVRNKCRLCERQSLFAGLPKQNTDCSSWRAHTAELSFRVPMHEMFRRIAHDLNPAGTFDIILEPRNQGRMGRPDWRIQDRISLGVYGYIEAKGPSNEPFDTTPYRDQINRYLTLGHKLIITDGIDFV